jgi:signal peptidase I
MEYMANRGTWCLPEPISFPMATAAQAPPKTSVKETVTSLIIAFAMAFVFRGFVMEAFVIPTGSMAPTLNGAHMRFKSPQSGYEWAVSPRFFIPPGNSQNPAPLQGGMTYVGPSGEKLTQTERIDVNDPQTLFDLHPSKVPAKWGDRIFVMKYLYSVYDPKRWDVIVFKNPRDPTVNYIKRLIGLPGEQVALVDGDVFVRTPTPADAKDVDPWTLPGWSIARKPIRARESMWQPMFNSEFAPVNPDRDGKAWFKAPWLGVNPANGEKMPGWEIGAQRVYTYSGSAPTRLAWDDTSRPIVDFYAYNQRGNFVPVNAAPTFDYPVSDIRLTAGVRPASAGQTVRAYVQTRDHAFEVQIKGADAVLRMRQIFGREPGPEAPWKELAKGTLRHALEPGVVTNISFEHIDQTLRLIVNDREALVGEYNWGPVERAKFAAGADLAEIEANPQVLSDMNRYTKPRAGFEFEGGGVTLYRVSLARDIFYQPALYGGTETGAPHSKVREPSAGSHPTSMLRLTNDQFFVCGDNSPQSLDARLWDAPNPWVAEIDPTMGVVNRELLIGKAFFVYFPAPEKRLNNIPLPDFGRMRFIW